LALALAELKLDLEPWSAEAWAVDEVVEGVRAPDRPGVPGADLVRFSVGVESRLLALVLAPALAVTEDRSGELGLWRCSSFSTTVE
jgi:hypothetical protein